MGWVMSYSGKIVLVTGAASGFGALAARRLSQAGALLILGDTDAAGLQSIGAELSASGDVAWRTTDVASDADAAALVGLALDRHGRLDIAFNNAGIIHDAARMADIEPEVFDRVMAVNARGVFLGMRHQLPAMAAQGSGAVVNTSSAAGLIGAPTLSAYAASKHAVIGLTRSAADEYARRGVRVNAICPSFAATPMFDGMADRMGLAADDAEARVVSRVPMGRVATAEEVVDAMLWIGSDANSFMTGQAISIDGGLTAI